MTNAGYSIVRSVRTTPEDDHDMGFCLGFNMDSPMKWVTWRYRKFSDGIDFCGGNYFAEGYRAVDDLNERVERVMGVRCASVYT